MRNRTVQAAMAAAGQTADSLAERIGVDPKTVARWVTQGRIPQTRYRAQVAGLLDRDPEELWPDAGRRGQPAWVRQWIEIERTAVALRWYESAVIPGLLQTEAYARAVLASGPRAGDADDDVDARMRRQVAVFDRSRPPLAVFVIDEAALRRGPVDIMAAQLDHLVDMAERTMINVVPFSAGLHPGQAGPFVIATTPDGEDVGYLDDQEAGRVTYDVASLRAVWDTVRSVALPRDLTTDFLRARSWLS
ncbi:Scr1 family TA system antitoxin-like transcriptional regulator [Micromonospora zhanjiangensis]|uniref:Scr1 family TA system antitoxin-like transcriptional regulator n=1 Tax=Micromonospora zhanjiangensis TaxID=1522057 RepID=A0ABV8KEP4_9ACTN